MLEDGRAGIAVCRHTFTDLVLAHGLAQPRPGATVDLALIETFRRKALLQAAKAFLVEAGRAGRPGR